MIHLSIQGSNYRATARVLDASITVTANTCLSALGTLQEHLRIHRKDYTRLLDAGFYPVPRHVLQQVVDSIDENLAEIEALP
jgi:hypothetical protein